MLWTFWGTIAAIAWAYVGYPLATAILGLLRPRPVRKADITPTVSLIIAAHNEEQVIGQRLANDLRLDYPSDKLEIIVASDGSSDATAEIVGRFAPRVTLLDLPRRGKIFALADAVAHSSAEILVFSDANVMLAPDALRKMVRNYADPQVGGVCGNQGHTHIEKAGAVGGGESLYWKYDRAVKELENRVGSVVSSHGAFHSIRRELFNFPRDTAVADDNYISTGVVLRGYRLVTEVEARASEDATDKAGVEFRRKTRVINRGLRSIYERRALLNPFRFGYYSLALFSHKILRRLVGHGMIALLISNAFLLRRGRFYQLTMAVQTLFYSLAGLGYALRHTAPGRKKVFYVPFYFCLINWAAVRAISDLLLGRKIGQWKTPRTVYDAQLEKRS